ncbi:MULTISPECIES: helix-turn-helix transcriptional regulator [Photobacterium]|uniref:helix-turn-helix domain-containing protein n=1 Tax=Photobacterium TaxID=657 RepID=UPI003001037B
MSTSQGEKLKSIREAECLARTAMAKMLEMPYSTLTSYERDTTTMNYNVICKLLTHDRFIKYSLWFTTDQTAPEAGQISPDLTHCGPEKRTSGRSGKKTG